MNKDLKRMGKSELLEILISQLEENEKLQKELDECRQKLNDRSIALESAGSIAEASLKLNGIFAAADIAARQYLENIRNGVNVSEEDADRFYEEALGKVSSSDYFPPVRHAEHIRYVEKLPAENSASVTAAASDSEVIREANKEADRIIAEAKAKSEKMIKDADRYWDETIKKARVLLKNHD